MALGWESSQDAAGDLGAAAPILESIPNLSLDADGLGQGVVVIRSPFTDQIPILPSSTHGWY